ncbi:ATP-binding protein, partial [Aerococcus loyolae]
MAVIRRLSEGTINRIAAGEVVERPASAVKELVENALDAGARHIDIVISGGGRDLIRVTDDGSGMSAEDLALAVERHATSKLAAGADRGQRLAILSRMQGADAAQKISVEGGEVSAVEPAAGPAGTRIEARDLFFATPARLKFLKGERAETLAVADVVKRLAMAHPAVAFSLTSETRNMLRLEAEMPGDVGRLGRLGAIMGRDFAENALAIEALREGIALT